MAPKVILDAKGLYTHMYYRGTDPDGILTEDGKVVNTAGWGFVNWLDEYLLPILENFSTSDIIAVWDGGNNYRTMAFPQYKAARKQQKEKAPAQLIRQMKLLENAVKAFLANLGIINLQCAGVEADDLIAHLCNALSDEDKIIHTVDADLLQLDDEHTYVFLKNVPVKGEYQGIPLHLIRLNKALVGDKSDGYIGVRRFGEKAWLALEKQFGVDGLEEIDRCFRRNEFGPMEEAVEVSGSRELNHVLENIKDAKHCYDLAMLHPGLCYGFQGSELVWPKHYVRVPDRSKVTNILNQMGCPDYLDRFERLLPVYTLVTKENEIRELEHFRNHLPRTPFVSFDYETWDTLQHPDFVEALPKQSRSYGYVDVLSSEVTGCSINYGSDQQYTMYLSVNHKDTKNCPKEVITEVLQAVQDEGIPLVAHNCSFEEMVTKLNLNFQIEKPYDTVIMSSYVDENEEAGLKALSQRLLNYEQVSYKDTLAAANANDMSELTGQQVLNYGCDDSLVTSHLFKLFQLIMKMEGTWGFYVNNERAPVHVLNHAFETGCRLNYVKVAELHEKADRVIDEGIDHIRKVLEEKCVVPDPAAAERLDEADGKNLIQIARFNDGKSDKGARSDDAYLSKRQETKLRWEAVSVYKPYVEEHIPPEFKGTPSQLNLVARALGVEHELTANSNKQINIWITEVRGALKGVMTEEQSRFLTCVAECAGQPLKKREGPEFEALTEFCLPFLGEGRIVREGDELNFNSPPQMQELLYCKLGLPIRRRTKVQRDSTRDQLGLEGSPATDEKAMKMAIAEDCSGEDEWKADILRTVIDVKEQQTLIGLYYRPYPLWKHPRDGMIHPAVRNCGTVTRRPTGSNPNILQVKKGETRTIYLPRHDDHVIVAIDFSGQELRITGSESKDPVLIDAYTGGGTVTDEDGMVHPVTKDIHSVTAISFAETIFQRELGSKDFDFTYDWFREALFCDDPKLSATANLCRKMAKVVNFLIIYGGQASTLAMNLSIPEMFAEELMRLVFAAYQRLEPWQSETIEFAYRHGYVKTAYGNLKHLTSDIRSKDGGKRSRQERQAVNQTIQGCAADILKVVLTGTHETNLWAETKSAMIAPVYDEIVATVPRSSLFEYCQRMQDLMNVTPPGHPIPMMAEVSVGPNWGEVVELGDRPSERKLIKCVEAFL